VLVTTARLPARSAAGYQRFNWLTRPMLQEVTCIAAQNREDGERFIALGLAADRLQVTGSIKFDIAGPADVTEEAGKLRAAWGA